MSLPVVLKLFICYIAALLLVAYIYHGALLGGIDLDVSVNLDV